MHVLLSPQKPVQTYFRPFALAMTMFCIHLSHINALPASAEPVVQAPAQINGIYNNPASKKRHKLIRKPESFKKATLSQAVPSASYQSVEPPAPIAVDPINHPSTEMQATKSTVSTAPLSQPQSSTSPSSFSSSLIGAAATPSTGNSQTQSSGLTAAASGGSSGVGSRQLGRLMSEMPGLNQLLPPTTTNPTLGLTPVSLSFNAQQGGGNPAAQSVLISNTGGGTLSWSATDNAAWLTLSPASGTGNGSLTATVATGSLTAGTHSATITATATGATPVAIPVTFTVTAAPVPPAIGVSLSSLSFTAQQGGGNPAAQSISITNTGGGTLSWSAADNAAWLTLSPASGTGNGSLTATVATGSLTAATYNAMITMSASGATPVSVPVTFTVTAASSTVTLSPTALTFSAVQGGSNPADQSLSITSNGSWTATSNTSWLTVSPSSGSGNGSLTAGINLSAATVGTNTATITVTGGGTTRTATVTLTTTAPSLTVSPGSLTYTATQGAANPASQSITVTSNGSWTVSDNASWLSVSTTSGSNNATIAATVNTSNMTTGNHSATITLTGAGITRTISVALTLNAPATSSATLTWNANTEPDLASYRIYRTTTPGVYGAALATVSADTLTYLATGLQAGTTYYFTVRAVDSAGNESTPSNEVSKSIF